MQHHWCHQVHTHYHDPLTTNKPGQPTVMMTTSSISTSTSTSCQWQQQQQHGKPAVAMISSKPLGTWQQHSHKYQLSVTMTMTWQTISSHGLSQQGWSQPWHHPMMRMLTPSPSLAQLVFKSPILRPSKNLNWTGPRLFSLTRTNQRPLCSLFAVLISVFCWFKIFRTEQRPVLTRLFQRPNTNGISRYMN